MNAVYINKPVVLVPQIAYMAAREYSKTDDLDTATKNRVSQIFKILCLHSSPDRRLRLADEGLDFAAASRVIEDNGDNMESLIEDNEYLDANSQASKGQASKGQASKGQASNGKASRGAVEQDVLNKMAAATARVQTQIVDAYWEIVTFNEYKQLISRYDLLRGENEREIPDPILRHRDTVAFLEKFISTLKANTRRSRLATQTFLEDSRKTFLRHYYKLLPDHLPVLDPATSRRGPPGLKPPSQHLLAAPAPAPALIIGLRAATWQAMRAAALAAAKPAAPLAVAKPAARDPLTGLEYDSD